MARAKKKYGVRPGSRVKGDPQAIGEELASIYIDKGELTAEGVIESAENGDSALHDEFVWDDNEAGHKYRLQQARTLIRFITTIKPKKTPMREWGYVKEKKQPGGYVPMEVIVQIPNAYQNALEALQSKVSSAIESVEELREAAGDSEHKSQLLLVNVITKALETAKATIKKMVV